MNLARTVVAGLGCALLVSLTGCSDSGSAPGPEAPDGKAAPVGAATGAPDASAGPKEYAGYGSGPVVTATPPAGTVFGLSEPVSIAYWWGQNPDTAPADLASYRMVFEEQADGPKVFPGPDVSEYGTVMMVITCTGAAAYSLDLKAGADQVASTSGKSCGGPEIAAYRSPALKDVAGAATALDVKVPAGTKYYVTMYGKPA